MSERTDDTYSSIRTSDDRLVRLDSLAIVLTLPHSRTGEIILKSFPLLRSSFGSRDSVALDDADMGVLGVEDRGVQLDVALMNDTISVSPEVLRQSLVSTSRGERAAGTHLPSESKVIEPALLYSMVTLIVAAHQELEEVLDCVVCSTDVVRLSS